MRQDWVSGVICFHPGKHAAYPKDAGLCFFDLHGFFWVEPIHSDFKRMLPGQTFLLVFRARRKVSSPQDFVARIRFRAFSVLANRTIVVGL
jgi:hypothetical protein